MAASSAAAPSQPGHPVAYGNQTAVVEGQDAAAQLRAHLKERLPEWLEVMTGSQSTNDGNVDAAVRALVASARLRTFGSGSPDATAVTQSCRCVKCNKPTVVDGLAGQGICVLCYAAGDDGLPNIDLNHLLVAGKLAGKGVSALCVLVSFGLSCPCDCPASVLSVYRSASVSS